MIIDAAEWWHKIVVFYLDLNDYHFQDDPNLTFQEFVMIHVLRFHANGGEFDLDKLDEEAKDWFVIDQWKEECVAHYFQPMVVDKPWNEVLNDKSNVKIILDTDEKGWLIGWKRKSPYKEWYKKEQEEKRKLLELDEERRKKQREYQRARRVRIKKERDSKNG